jgi:hypothetical protein
MEVSGQFQAATTLSLGKKAFGSHWIGGRAGSRVELDALEKRKISYPCRKLNHDPSEVQSIAYSHYTNWAIPALYFLLSLYLLFLSLYKRKRNTSINKEENQTHNKKAFKTAGLLWDTENRYTYIINIYCENHTNTNRRMWQNQSS